MKPQREIRRGRGARRTAPVLTHEPPRDHDIPDRVRTLLWALCWWAWEMQPECWPSNEAIREHLGWSLSKTKRTVAEAIAAGYLRSRFETTTTGRRRVLTITDREAWPRLATEGGGGLNPEPRGGLRIESRDGLNPEPTGRDSKQSEGSNTHKEDAADGGVWEITTQEIRTKGAKGRPAGSRQRPPAGREGHSMPVAKDCAEESPPLSRGEHPTQHKRH